tara:strand:+ start:113 stop:367 length:255 start_codon:yes stop_codon:yes gene_type:complete
MENNFMSFDAKQAKDVLKKLDEASSMIEYAISENSSADSSLSGIEGLSEVSSAKDYVSQADYYMYEAQSAIDKLKYVIKERGAV